MIGVIGVQFISDRYMSQKHVIIVLKEKKD